MRKYGNPGKALQLDSAEIIHMLDSTPIDYKKNTTNVIEAVCPQRNLNSWRTKKKLFPELLTQ